MIRIVRLSVKYYGYPVPEDGEDAMEEINGFVRDGVPAIVVSDIEDLWDLDIDPTDVQMVEDD